MRRAIYISILVGIFTLKASAQIKGQLFQYDSEYPGAKVLIEGEFSQADFDGKFELPIPKNKETFNLIIDLNNSFSPLKVIIKNLNINKLTKIDLGKIHLPNYKTISISEFEQLPEIEKENCKATFHWSQLNGYILTNKLENDQLTLNCDKKISNYNFNTTDKTITVDWKEIKKCI